MNLRASHIKPPKKGRLGIAKLHFPQTSQTQKGKASRRKKEDQDWMKKTLQKEKESQNQNNPKTDLPI